MIIYTDGASRGNPGPAAAGYVVGGISYGKKLGVQTNNYAEYMAIILSLQKAREVLGDTAQKTTLEVRMDSQLAVRQLSGQYRVKSVTIKPLYEQVVTLRHSFKKVSFVHVPREKNTEADQAANDALDGKQ